MTPKQQIRVGIIGAGNWAMYGHIPALRLLDRYRITAVSSRTFERARTIAAQFSIPYALDHEEALVTHPEVDLVVVLPPAPAHARLVKHAIVAGKDVYCEWPLTTHTTESNVLLDLATVRGVRHAVGLQRTISPSSLFLGDLLRGGFVGQMRSVRMHVSMEYFGEARSKDLAWTVPADNFSHILSIYGGHFMDMLFRAVGQPKNLSARSQIQFPFLTVDGERVRNQTSDEIMIIGELTNGALFQIQIEGGKTNYSGLRIEITGTSGDLLVTNPKSFETTQEDAIYGASGNGDWARLPVPEQYRRIPNSELDFSVQDLAHMYAAFAVQLDDADVRVPDFSDAVRMHCLIDAISLSSSERREVAVGVIT